MAIPDYQTMMLPLLQLARDKQEHRFRDAVEQLASQFELTDSERSELLPSGTAPVFDNRVGWARTYLKQAGLLASPKRGAFRITEEGMALLSEKLEKKLMSTCYLATQNFKPFALGGAIEMKLRLMKQKLPL